MKQGICHLSQIPLRGEPKSSGEMVSQLIFGETYDILREEEDWYFIRMHFDGYEGWISDSSLYYIEQRSKREVQSELFETKNNDLLKGSIITSMGSEVESSSTITSTRFIEDIAKSFLGSPYLWGGRHFSGIDCSGFVQIVYKVLGKQLPRDASQQQKVGKPIAFADLYMGDLVFFEKNFKIGHVGMFMGNGKIIHSHGCVRIDTLTKKGIINVDSEVLTHQYHSAKRIT